MHTTISISRNSEHGDAMNSNIFRRFFNLTKVFQYIELKTFYRLNSVSFIQWSLPTHSVTPMFYSWHHHRRHWNEEKKENSIHNNICLFIRPKALIISFGYNLVVGIVVALPRIYVRFVIAYYGSHRRRYSTLLFPFQNFASSIFPVHIRVYCISSE